MINYDIRWIHEDYFFLHKYQFLPDVSLFYNLEMIDNSNISYSVYL